MALPTCECVKGLPIGEQLAAIYCATYTLAGGDTEGLTPNIAWVTPTGDDSTGEVGNPYKPYATPTGAISDVSEGDLIHVMPGEYSDVIVAPEGKTLRMYWYSGAILDVGAESAAIVLTGAARTVEITGYGRFRATNSALLIENSADGSVVDLKCLELDGAFLAGSTVNAWVGSLTRPWTLTGAGINCIHYSSGVGGFATSDSASARIVAYGPHAGADMFLQDSGGGRIDHFGPLITNNSDAIQTLHDSGVIYQHGRVYAANDCPVYCRNGKIVVFGDVESGNISEYNWEGRGCGVCAINLGTEVVIYGEVKGIVSVLAGEGSVTIYGNLFTVAEGTYSEQVPHDTGVDAAYYPANITGGHCGVVVHSTGVIEVRGNAESSFGNTFRLEAGNLTLEGGSAVANAAGASTGWVLKATASSTISLRGGVTLSAGAGVSEVISADAATTINIDGASANKGSDKPVNCTLNLRGLWYVNGRRVVPFVRAYRNSDVTIASGGTQNTLIFETESVDNWGMYNPATGETTIAMTGDWTIDIGTFWYAGLNAITGAIYVNGTRVIQAYQEVATVANVKTGSWTLRLASGDVVTYRVSQDGGANRDIGGFGTDYTRLQITMR